MLSRSSNITCDTSTHNPYCTFRHDPQEPWRLSGVKLCLTVSTRCSTSTSTCALEGELLGVFHRKISPCFKKSASWSSSCSFKIGHRDFDLLDLKKYSWWPTLSYIDHIYIFQYLCWIVIFMGLCMIWWFMAYIPNFNQCSWIMVYLDSISPPFMAQAPQRGNRAWSPWFDPWAPREGRNKKETATTMGRTAEC